MLVVIAGQTTLSNIKYVFGFQKVFNATKKQKSSVFIASDNITITY